VRHPGNYVQSGAYTYDAESRMSSANQGQTVYGYDGDGNRIMKTPGKLYWAFSTMGSLAESDLNGHINSEYIYFDGKRVARIDYTTVHVDSITSYEFPEVHYYFSDHLGSASMIAAANGWIEQESEYYPYGGERLIQGSDSNVYKFTGKERDSETGLDYFGARYYASNTGRFLTPDWAARPTAIPYAVFGDPQSLNLYVYVRNDPISRLDPDGHSDCTGANASGIGCITQARMHEFYFGARAAGRAIMNSVYIKKINGNGLNLSVKVAGVKVEIAHKAVTEAKQTLAGDKTAKNVNEIGIKVDVGPAKAGLARETSQPADNNGKVLPGSAPKTEWLPVISMSHFNGDSGGFDFPIIGGTVHVGPRGGGWEFGVHVSLPDVDADFEKGKAAIPDLGKLAGSSY
jgi:RHS repeat-associated protein